MSFIKPLRDSVLIKKDTPDVKTASGLYIPATSNTNQTTGTVVAVGIDVKEIRVNDTVVFLSPGIELTQDNQKVYLMSETDILAILG